jgi:hypothetical protein
VPAVGTAPVVRKTEGKTLPRAFVVRRRSPAPVTGAPLDGPSSQQPRPEQSLPERNVEEAIATSDTNAAQVPSTARSSPTFS